MSYSQYRNSSLDKSIILIKLLVRCSCQHSAKDVRRYNDSIRLLLPKITIVGSNSGSSKWLAFKLSINANSALKQIFQSVTRSNCKKI